MKVVPLKNLFLNKAPLAIVSLFLGYSFWHMASVHHLVSLHVSVPLCFTQTADTYDIDAPETIDIILQGKRSDLYALENDSLAAHVNINKLLPGKHGIIITEKNLFLPQTITLTHYKPSNLTITIRDTKQL
jgi:hypothetical protein